MLNEKDYENCRREFRWLDERSNCILCNKKTDRFWACYECRDSMEDNNITKKRRSEVVHVYLYSNMKKTATEISKKQRRNVSELIEQAIEEYIKKEITYYGFKIESDDVDKFLHSN